MVSEDSKRMKAFARELNQLCLRYSVATATSDNVFKLKHYRASQSWAYFTLRQDPNTFELSFANVRSPDVPVYDYEGEL